MSVPDKELINFVIREARMLDEARYEDWLELFADDGIYWMPLEHDQTEEHLTTSLMYEDRFLLLTRVKRLAGERTFSQKPKSRCQHLLQTPVVDERSDDDGRYITYTPFHYVESREDEQTLLAGWMRHTLVLNNQKLKIERKRVDLVNCDSAHRNIQLFI